MQQIDANQIIYKNHLKNFQRDKFKLTKQFFSANPRSEERKSQKGLSKSENNNEKSADDVMEHKPSEAALISYSLFISTWKFILHLIEVLEKTIKRHDKVHY